MTSTGRPVLNAGITRRAELEVDGSDNKSKYHGRKHLLTYNIKPMFTYGYYAVIYVCVCVCIYNIFDSLLFIMYAGPI